MIVAILLASIIFTGAAVEGVLRITMPHWQEFHSGRFLQRSHGVLTGKPGFNGYFAQNEGDFRVHIGINGHGLRNPAPVEEADGKIWVVGDSFAFGWGVEQWEMYSSIIGAYNVASPGTNVCGYQTMVARMPKTVRPRAVIVGLVVENDLRVYNCEAEGEDTDVDTGIDWIAVKQALTKHSALYNFLAVRLKRIGSVRNALVTIGLVREEHAYRRQVTDIDAAINSTANELMDLRVMGFGGTRFAVLIVPSRFEIRDGDAFYRQLRQRMGEALTIRGIAVIDPIERFMDAGFSATHFPHDGHWSALGHKLAGEAAALWLEGGKS